MTKEKQIDKVVCRAIRCDGCHDCCKNSSAQVLASEVETFVKLEVPLQKIGSSYFIKPRANGDCPMLGSNKECQIYESRPLSCRIFPFYPMNRYGHYRRWVIYNFCPAENQLLKTFCIPPSLPDLRIKALDIEKILGPQDIEEMLEGDLEMENQDRLETGALEYIPVIEIPMR